MKDSLAPEICDRAALSVVQIKIAYNIFLTFENFRFVSVRLSKT